MAGCPDHYAPIDVAYWETFRIAYEMGEITERQWRREAMWVDDQANIRAKALREHRERMERLRQEYGL